MTHTSLRRCQRNRPAPDSCTRSPRRLRRKIVRARMDDDTFSDNVSDGTGAHLPFVCRQFDFAGAVFANRHVADVTEVKFSDSPFSVRDFCGIPMPACRLPVGRTAISYLVDMNGVESRRRVLNLNRERD